MMETKPCRQQREPLDPMIPYVMGAWHSWGSPVGLGLFFILGAVAIDLIRLALR